MRIAYFDLGYSNEQYGLQPTRYGGGAVVARYLKEDPSIDFTIFAPESAFDNVGPTERRDRCVVLPPEACEALKRGYPLSLLTPFMDSFDLVLHPHTCESLSKGTYRGPVVQFCGFDGSAGHPRNDYVLLYDPTFVPRFGERPKYVKIGKPVPPAFVEYPKEDFVFQCSRHDTFMNSIEVAKACLDTGIKGIFAGPIHNGYPLLDYIDGKTTIYLGEISEQQKMYLHRHARLFALLVKWEPPFNQSIIETQGVGTPIWVNNTGPFFKRYLRNGVNGFDAKHYDLLGAFTHAKTINQCECWVAAKEFSVEEMVASFKRAFEEITQEWKR